MVKKINKSALSLALLISFSSLNPSLAYANEDFKEEKENRVIYQTNDKVYKNEDNLNLSNAESFPEDTGVLNPKKIWEKGYDGRGQVIAIIDSGIDPDHPDLKNINYPQDAVYKSEGDMAKKIEELNKKGHNIKGKYYNPKVVYAYNYYDGVQRSNEKYEHVVKETESKANTRMHGTHVSGISSANGLLKGVAPEAQIMMMRIVGESIFPGIVEDTTIAKAINDAVLLGATSINMSLTTAAQSKKKISKELSEAIKNASESGCIVNIASGNDGHFAYGFSKPKADAPDYGLVGTPTVHENSIAVASVNNKLKHYKTIIKEDETRAAYDISTIAKPTYDNYIDYEYLNFGEKKDFKDKNLEGKYVLASRGKVAFSEMVKEAKSAKAIGLIVINNQEGEDEPFLAGNVDFAGIPVITVGNTTGTNLINEKQKIKFTKNLTAFTVEEPEKMSVFSTWGLGIEGDFKPEITAPGGHVYSTINDGEYADYYGTSMATPQVTGAAALVQARIDKEFPKYNGIKRNRLVKNLLMSTAKPHIDKETGAYSSPRKQGAGLINIEGAIKSNLILIDQESEISKVAKGQVDGEFDLKLRIINLSSKEKTLKLTTTVQTDQVKEGFFTLKPRLLDTIDGGSLSVEPNNIKDFTVKIDYKHHIEDLKKEMPNGFYVEGFVNLNSDDENIGLPYVAFNGDWAKVPILEKSVYDYDMEKEKPIYFEEDGSSGDFTYLSSKEGEKRLILGAYEKEGKIHYDKDKIAISPNEDNKADYLSLNGVFLRAYKSKEFKLRVYKEGENAPFIDKSLSSPGKNNYYGGNRNNKKSEGYSTPYYHGKWKWDGKNASGKIEEGKYYVDYVLKADIDKDSKYVEEQVYRFPVIVDNTKPSLKEVDFDKGREELSFEAFDQVSEVREAKVIGADGKEIPKNANNTYSLSKDVDLAKIKIEVTDLAFNTDKLDPSKFLVEKATFKVDLGEENKEILEKIKIKVLDENQKEKEMKLDKESGNFRLRLGQGNYKIKVENLPQDYKLKNEDLTIEIKDIENTKEFNLKLDLVKEELKEEKIEENKGKETEKLQLDLKEKSERLAGPTRFETALKISQKGFEKAETVYLVNGNKEVDALAVAKLADKNKGPVLLVEKDQINEETLEEIKRLGTKKIEIIGGTEAISDGILESLKDYEVRRIAGKNRFQTSAEIAKENGLVDKLILANGNTLADALAASALAIKEERSIILVEENSIPEEVKEIVEGAKDIVIVGLEKAISKDLGNSLKAEKVERIGGENRYLTSIKIAQRSFENPKKLALANGEKFADSLVFGPLTGKEETPIILVRPDGLEEETKKYLKNINPEKVFVLGGERAINKGLVD